MDEDSAGDLRSRSRSASVTARSIPECPVQPKGTQVTHAATSNRIHRTGLPLLLAMLGTSLAGCGGEDDPPVATASSTSATATASASSGSSAPTPSSAIPPAPGAGTSTNRAPVIAGTPAAAINASASYAFMPAATDADGDSLTFTITNKPAWATFNTTTGRLTGTPTLAQVGTYANITIAVSDGKTTTSLGAFSIAVTQISTGTAALSWLPPTENTDGSQLTNLSGYRIYYGTSAAALNQSIEVNNAGLSNYVVQNLSPATWYFAVKAVASGVESNLSNVATKTIS